MPRLSNDTNISVLDITPTAALEANSENRFTGEWLEEMETSLAHLEDKVARGDKFAVVIIGQGKFFSNGLDVASILDPQGSSAYVLRVSDVLRRLLILGAPTISALNGHAFGAGALLALCTDQAVMRTERGYFSFPEVAIGVNFPVGMAELIVRTLPPHTARRAMLTAKRYSSAEALEAGIIDAQVPVESLLQAAIERVNPLVEYASPRYSDVKSTLYSSVINALRIAPEPLG